MIKNIHEKLLETVQLMLVDSRVNLPYYGNFNLFVNFSENEKIGTCAVNVTPCGMNFFYSSKFLEKLTQKQVNFVTLHENFHLLWDHPKRTITGSYDPKLSNIAQDMIINHIIVEDINPNFIEIPKDDDGKNMALFVPKEYDGKLVFEELYEWLRDKKEEMNKNGTSGKPEYGDFGKDPKNSQGGTIETYSLEHILSNLDKNNGEYLDVHITDEVSEDVRESMVKDTMDRLQSRGYSSSSVERTLNKLRKKRKDYLSFIKRTISNFIFGTIKNKTIVRPSRRGIQGVKGVRKVKNRINVGLDTSGSMGGQGTFERVLSYVFRSDIEMNFMESDTELKWVQNIKNAKKLQSVPIKGLGGTCLQPMIDHISKNYNDCNTVLLTDGITDTLDLSRLKGKVLIISVEKPCPIGKSNGRLKQIVIDGKTN